MRRGLTVFACAAISLAATGCSTTQTGRGFGPVFTTVAGLAAQATKAGNDITSVRGTLRVKSGPLDQTSTFSEQLSRGRVTAFDDRISTTYQATARSTSSGPVKAASRGSSPPVTAAIRSLPTSPKMSTEHSTRPACMATS